MPTIDNNKRTEMGDEDDKMSKAQKLFYNLKKIPGNYGNDLLIRKKSFKREIA